MGVVAAAGRAGEGPKAVWCRMDDTKAVFSSVALSACAASADRMATSTASSYCFRFSDLLLFKRRGSSIHSNAMFGVVFFSFRSRGCLRGCGAMPPSSLFVIVPSESKSTPSQSLSISIVIAVPLRFSATIFSATLLPVYPTLRAVAIRVHSRCNQGCRQPGHTPHGCCSLTRTYFFFTLCTRFFSSSDFFQCPGVPRFSYSFCFLYFFVAAMPSLTMDERKEERSRPKRCLLSFSPSGGGKVVLEVCRYGWADSRPHMAIRAASEASAAVSAVGKEAPMSTVAFLSAGLNDAGYTVDGMKTCQLETK